MNAVYANYLESDGHQFSFMPADEEIWGHALDKWEGAGAKGSLIEFLDWDALEFKRIYPADRFPALHSARKAAGIHPER